LSELQGKRFGLLLVLTVVGVLIVAANLWKSSLIVKRLTVEGNRIVETNEILQLAHVTKGMKMYDIDLTLIQKDVMSHHFIKDVIVQRDLPVTLKITVTEREPIAMVNRNNILYLDAEGIVLPHSISREVFDLPLITGIPTSVPVTVGSRIVQTDVREALSILSAAKMVNKELYHLISEIKLRNGGDIVLYSAEEGIPIIFGRGDIVGKLIRLETFWKDIVREKGPQQLQYVDLRYADQVVVRWASTKNKTKTS
jgi:cell division protein FtsQ